MWALIVLFEITIYIFFFPDFMTGGLLCLLCGKKRMSGRGFVSLVMGAIAEGTIRYHSRHTKCLMLCTHCVARESGQSAPFCRVIGCEALPCYLGPFALTS